MAIIVEDGTGVANANSYVTVAELDSFAALRGDSLPATDPEKEVLLIKGTDYTEAFWNRFQGQTTNETQVLQFPRSGVSVNNRTVESNSIPQNLKNAQMQAAIEQNTTDLTPNTGQNIKKEKVDVIEVEYQDGDGSLQKPRFPKVDAYLNPLLSAVANRVVVSR